jgi:hypothetical protein
MIGKQMAKQLLQEYLSPSVNQMVTESTESKDGGKNFYMRGIFIEGDVQNANGRIYPVNEIERAVGQINEQIKKGNSVLGEVDHPDDLKINLDRVSHVIQEMWVDGPTGFGKLKILPTPMGDIIGKMLGAGVKLGVSSRGSGNVDDMSGKVSDFEIVTVDVVATPSAPRAYPTAVYESLLNSKHGYKSIDLLKEDPSHPKVQKYVAEQVIKLIKELRL